MLCYVATIVKSFISKQWRREMRFSRLIQTAINGKIGVMIFKLINRDLYG